MSNRSFFLQRESLIGTDRLVLFCDNRVVVKDDNFIWQHKHVIDLLQEKLEKDGVTTDIIRGDVSANNRTRIFDEFQNTPDPQVLIIQPQAAAHGVTLTAANTIVWWGPTSSLETYAQANARVHRSGQTHPCTVVQLQGSPVEKAVYRMLDNRINVHTKMIDLYEEVLES